MKTKVLSFQNSFAKFPSPAILAAFLAAIWLAAVETASATTSVRLL